MDEVECVGTETTLANCRFQGWSINDCDHSEDAAVICQTSKDCCQLILFLCYSIP